MEKILNDVKKIIATKLDRNLSVEQISDNASLLEDGLCLDSIALVNFLVNVENHFNIEFNDNEIVQDLFRDIQKLSLFIETKLN